MNIFGVLKHKGRCVYGNGFLWPHHKGRPQVPVTGKIDEIFYKPGKFIDASLDKASEDNERNLIKYSNSLGKTFAIVQIAGLVARRIVCEVKEGQNLNQGDRIGIIRFGSRVDLYFDNDYKLLAKQGQTVVAGESLLAKI